MRPELGSGVRIRHGLRRKAVSIVFCTLENPFDRVSVVEAVCCSVM